MTDRLGSGGATIATESLAVFSCPWFKDAGTGVFAVIFTVVQLVAAAEWQWCGGGWGVGTVVFTEIAVVWTVSLCPRNVRSNAGLLSVGFTCSQGVFAPLAGWSSGLRCGGGANRNHVGAVQFLATVTRNSVQSTERWQLGVDWTSRCARELSSGCVVTSTVEVTAVAPRLTLLVLTSLVDTDISASGDVGVSSRSHGGVVCVRSEIDVSSTEGRHDGE